MKHLLPLLLCIVLLCACAQTSSPHFPSTVQTEPEEVPDSPTYVPGHPLAQSAPEALRVYPLDTPVQALVPMGQKLLLISGGETTDLTLLEQSSLSALCTYHLPFRLTGGDLQIGSTTLSCYDPVRRETLVLSSRLTEISRISSPEGIVGKPLYSDESNTLFYCTGSAVRAWNLNSGIRRCVREQAGSTPEILGIHLDGSLLQCRISDADGVHTLFLSAQTGQLLGQWDADVTLQTGEGRFFALADEGAIKLNLFGQDAQEPQQLTPGDIYSTCYYLPEQNRAVCVSADLALNCYDLASGKRTNRLRLIGQYRVLSIAGQGRDGLWLLLEDIAGDAVLCHWDLSAQACRIADSLIYTGPRFTREQPDTAALDACALQAQRIGEKYGIQVLIAEAPLSVCPWDYTFETEYLAPVLSRELEELDKRLSAYPPEIFSGIQQQFSGLSICLVREIRGSPASGSVAQANGVQFFQGSDSYIALAVGAYAERALYHELYHVMETRLLTRSAAFDRWDALNPADFAYDYDYTANAARQAEAYLQPENRSFIDRYSMSFPKEDRARIMECAMLEGSEDLFSSPVMQAKLSLICQAIREAYQLKGSPKSYLWEQYLR